MKRIKFLVCALLCISFFASCDKEDENNLTSKNENTGKYESKPIVLPSKTIEWDESYHPGDKLRSGVNYSSEMAVISSNIHIGGVYSAASVENLTLAKISRPLKPITVAYTFPGYFVDVITNPSISGQIISLNKAINSPAFSGKQSLSFEYDFKQFSHYSELKLAFGANANVGSLFKLNASHEQEKINLKTGLFARVVQKNFSLLMDYPEDGNVFKLDTDLAATASSSPVYINSIIFGRMAIIAIESTYSYEEIKTAFKIALAAKVVNGELSLDVNTKSILESADIKILASGGKGHDVAKLVEGFHEFTNYIINGGEFTKEVPGVPIFFTANYAFDNSIFTTSFTTE